MRGCGFLKTWCHVCIYYRLDCGSRVGFGDAVFWEGVMFFRIKKSGGRAYVQVVENKRVDGAVRQSVIANVGRADDLIASGALASLLASGAKLTDQVLLINALGEDASLGLGHRRLSILDLSPLGHQPMSYQDRYWIVYNGEVYNYLELRPELEAAGHRFRSHCDTEVILAAYAQWGAECFSRFNGMWALAIYDARTDELVLARDRFGVKPLYYWATDSLFA